jgi:two-component system sensor histidine kinase BaeS
VTRSANARTTLRLRLLGAFVAVAAAAIAAFAVLTLLAGRSDVNALVHRQQQATAADAVAALADAYRSAGDWTTADLRTARAVAVAGGALLEVRDSSGKLLLRAARGLGPGSAGRAGGNHLSTAYGEAQVLPVVVDGSAVGSASVSFPSGALPPAEKQLRDALTRTTLYGALIAAAVALVVGLAVAEGITRPLRRLIHAVRRLGAGDRAARANLEAPGELGELAAAVDTMAAALEREDELRRALTADVAHELRTPVTILAAQCEAMLDGFAEPGPEQIASLHDEVLRLGRVIDDLETLASAEAAALRLHLADVAVGALVEETARLVAPQFAAAEVTLETHVEPVTVRGDELRLAQVVRNLLANALKFTPAGGHVEITLQPRGRFVELSVADTGVGITADDLPRVFDRFWRGANGRATSGSGIGLAVVAELVRAHGGRVSVSSEPGSGTRFDVELPQV